MKYNWIVTVVFVLLAAVACKKQTQDFPDPYSGGKQPLDLVFNNATAPVPALGTPGTVVSFSAKGLVKYNVEGPNKIVFMFNGEVAEIVSVSETTIVVKVPENASSGATSISIGDQVFFGPQFKVSGKIMIDPFYKAKNGANDVVRVAYILPDGRMVLGGDFTNYDNQASDLAPTRRIVLTAADGEIDRSYRFGKGASDRITSITASADQQKLFIAGSFGAYDRMERFTNNITTTLYNGNLDTTSVLTYTGTIFGNTRVTVPVFNGGTNSGILKLFNVGDKVIAAGNFNYYLTRRYSDRSVGTPSKTDPGVTIYIDTVYVDSTEMHQLIRFNKDGSLDKGYHFNAGTNKTYEGGNGSITSAFQQADGKIILVGNFTKFDGAAAGRIVRLNLDGTVDNTFSAGTGANSTISSITFNSVTKKFILTGTFGAFNGVTANQMILLNEDGSVDNSFVAKDFANGFPSFARQISNGLIIVGGGFKKYNNVRRAGFVVLTATGALAPGYNTSAEFSGSIVDVLERRNSDNKLSLLLLGGISKFDGQVVNNITSIALD